MYGHRHKYNKELRCSEYKINDQIVYLDLINCESIDTPPGYDKEEIPEWKCDKFGLYYFDNHGYQQYLHKLLFNKLSTNIIFKNENCFDLRKSNIGYKKIKVPKIIKKSDIEPDSDIYHIIEYIGGHVPKMGKSAGKLQNPKWYVFDNKTGEEYCLMYCRENSWTKFDYDQLDKVLYLDGKTTSWYLLKNGYIGAHIDNEYTSTIRYLHQILIDHYGSGKGQNSIDHINRDKLDNRLENLRIVDQSEQNRNRAKRTRNKNARPLPKELEGIKLPKFVVYYHEITNKVTGSWRNYFKVEKHPGCPPNKSGKRIWVGSKSKKISLLDRLETAKEMCDQFDKNIEKEIKVV